MVAAAIATLITIATKLLDKTPNYSQKKREQWHDLQQRYSEELKKLYPERDDDLVMNLREQIILFASTFDQEIK